MKNECPCQSGNAFSDCCKPLLNNQKRPVTAEQLMRSRYTAYTLRDWKYLFKTWHKSTRPPLAELRNGGQTDWLGLRVITCEKGLPGDKTGMVKFTAIYTCGTTPSQLTETSQFVFEKGQWFYLDGE